MRKLGPLGTFPQVSTLRSCASTGCPLTTREGKPYCPEHVGRHPYVREILGQLAARDEEFERVRARGENGWSAVNLEGLTATEITEHLRIHGERTIERIRREYLSSQPETVAKSYAKALVKGERITLGRTARGSIVLRLR